jgi:hypothetical protein
MREVFYDDTLHKYYTILSNGREKVYLSATQILKMVQKPFNAKERAIAYAKKHGNTPEYWLEQWENKKNYRCEVGNVKHRVNELRDNLMFGGSSPVLIDYSSLKDGLYTELKLWHHSWGIAGRTDRATIRTIYGVRYIDIDDYKTNEVFTTRGYQFRNGTHKMLLHPVSHLEDSKLSMYTLQVSLYTYMAESMGFVAGNRTLIHIDDNDEKVVYKVPYLKDDIINILTHAKRIGKI